MQRPDIPQSDYVRGLLTDEMSGPSDFTTLSLSTAAVFASGSILRYHQLVSKLQGPSGGAEHQASVACNAHKYNHKDRTIIRPALFSQIGVLLE